MCAPSELSNFPKAVALRAHLRVGRESDRTATGAFLYRSASLHFSPAKQGATSEQLDSSTSARNSPEPHVTQPSAPVVPERSHGLGPAEHGHARLHLPSLPGLLSDARAVQAPPEIYFQVNYGPHLMEKNIGVMPAWQYEQGWRGCMLHRASLCRFVYW